jgi:hypothetical protein
MPAEPDRDQEGTEMRTLSWGNAGGPTYYAVGDGSIQALLYWDDGGPGELYEPGGEPVIMNPGWYVVLADDPSNHFDVDAPGLEPGMADADLARATEAAMAAATGLVADHLNR